MARIGGSKSQRGVDYFKAKFLGLDPLSVRKEIVSGVPGMTDAIFYTIVKRMRRANEDAKAGGAVAIQPAVEPPVPEDISFSIEFPSDLSPNAKEQFNKLLSYSRQKEEELRVRDMEMASLRGQLASNQGRCRLLRKISTELLESA